ncbi:MAG: hypothetical protein PF630_03055 [Gammaproteobacteria bacterium]|jgi:hypothetical protein|nr:hypothetical protein [Gammaproteobacteria bacterium]
MEKKPLIMTLKNDINGAAVYWGLHKNGIVPTWVETLSDSEIEPITLTCNGRERWSASGIFDRDRVGSVWFRRPQWPISFNNSASYDSEFLQGEWSKLQRNVYSLAEDLTDTLWINKPSSAYKAENKLVQLQSAQRCGIGFPDTLVSNNSSDIRQFIKKHDKVIYKPFILPAWEKKESGRMYTFWVRVIDKNMVIDDDSLALCPGIYQEYIDKTCDLRVTIIGDHFFTVKIQSNRGNALVDWRSNSITEEMQVKIFDLPIKYKYKIKSLMKDLNVVFGCIDLVIDNDGEIYFLEINQGGQYLFVEKMVESFPLLQAMCSMIAEGRVDYAIDTVKNVSFARYIKSNFHLNWIAKVKDDIDTESLASRAMLE